MLSPSSLQWLESFWPATLGCSERDFGSPGITVVDRDGQNGVSLFVRRQSCCIWTPPAFSSAIRRAVRGLPIEAVFSADFIGGVLSAQECACRGPALLAYADSLARGSDSDPRIRLFEPKDVNAARDFAASVSPKAWLDGGVVFDPDATAVACVGGEIVAAASYSIWRGRIAQLGVVAHPARGRGLGRAVALAAARRACKMGLIAQCRGYHTNRWTTHTAKALGFHDYASTLEFNLRSAS